MSKTNVIFCALFVGIVAMLSNGLSKKEEYASNVKYLSTSDNAIVSNSIIRKMIEPKSIQLVAMRKDYFNNSHGLNETVTAQMTSLD
ncbi:hypothetical protein ACFQ1M_14765 [Sungkyunkwania multivorans]|uniref:Uncharacterized protein n=1 Tax=Sungkyunkwania multivorans TaxID=1173618 RepID=A0ABW3D364_9FLAO